MQHKDCSTIRVRLTEEEAALIYLYRCLDERGKGGAMNYITFTYSRMTRNAILQNRSNAADLVGRRS